MPEADLYRTLAGPATGQYKEKGSKFLAFAFPVQSEDEVREHLAALRKTYFDARHHCFAYQLGTTAVRFRANDDGEPNHSAGDPILGQIRSAGLTQVLVVVVRYFGGVKLGVGGLIQAYKTAAAAALAAGEIVERREMEAFRIRFGYDQMNAVMLLVKQAGLEVRGQDFGSDCSLEVAVRKNAAEAARARLSDLPGVIVVGF